LRTIRPTKIEKTKKEEERKIGGWGRETLKMKRAAAKKRTSAVDRERGKAKAFQEGKRRIGSESQEKLEEVIQMVDGRKKGG